MLAVGLKYPHKLAGRIGAILRHFPTETLLFVFPAILILFLIRLDLLTSRLLISGEFPSSLDYGRIAALYAHSWNDSFGLGFANYRLMTEGGAPEFFYSPMSHWLFHLWAALVEKIVFSPLLFYLYIVWFLFFLGAYLLSRACWIAPRLTHVLIALVTGLLYGVNPQMLNLITSGMSPLSEALILIVIALYLLLLKPIHVNTNRIWLLQPYLWCVFVGILWCFASIGIIYYPFLAVALALLSAVHLAQTKFQRPALIIHALLWVVVIVVFFFGNAHWLISRILFSEGQLFGGVTFPEPIAYPIDQGLTLGFLSQDSPRLSVSGLRLELRWLYLALALLGIALTRRREAILFLLLLVLGAFLGKGTSQPWPEINRWLHQSLPFADMLRSSYRYWSFILLSYAYGLGALVWWLSQVRGPVALSRIVRLGCPIGLSVLLVGLSGAFFTGDLRGKLFDVSLPAEYFELSSQLSPPAPGARLLYLPDDLQSIAWDYTWSPDKERIYGSIQRSPLTSLLFPRIPQANSNIYKTDVASRLSWYLLHAGFTSTPLLQTLLAKLDIAYVALDTFIKPGTPAGQKLENKRHWLDANSLVRRSLGDVKGLLLYDAGQPSSHVAFGRPIYVLGDLNAFKTLAEAAPNLVRRPLLFLHQNRPLWRDQPFTGQDLVIIDMDLTDLSAELISERYHVRLNDLVRFNNSPHTWRKATFWDPGLIDHDGADFRKDPIYAQDQADLDVPIELGEGPYIVLIHVLYNRPDHPIWPASPTLELHWNGLLWTTLNILKGGTWTTQSAGFRWVTLGEINPGPGRHMLTLRNPTTGRVSAVDGLIVVPKHQWEEARRRAMDWVRNNHTVFYYTPGFLVSRYWPKVAIALRGRPLARSNFLDNIFKYETDFDDPLWSNYAELRGDWFTTALQHYGNVLATGGLPGIYQLDYRLTSTDPLQSLQVQWDTLWLNPNRRLRLYVLGDVGWQQVGDDRITDKHPDSADVSALVRDKRQVQVRVEIEDRDGSEHRVFLTHVSFKGAIAIKSAQYALDLGMTGLVYLGTATFPKLTIAGREYAGTRLSNDTITLRPVGVVAGPLVSASSEVVIHYKKLDSSHYRVHLEAPSDGLLVFRESYNPYWDAGGRRPLITDYYANGYFFPAGTYDFMLQHQPDTVYRLSLTFVTLMPVLMFGIALVLARKEARMRHRVILTKGDKSRRT